MQKILFFLTALCMLLSAPSFSQNKKEKSSGHKAERRAEKRAAEQAWVLECVKNKNIKIVISRIFPTESAALQNTPVKINRNTLDGYYVQIKGDLFSCYLPYIGVSRSVSIGEELSLQAKEQTVGIKSGFDKKTGSYRYDFSYKNDNNSSIWECSIQLFLNGDAVVRMYNPSRDPISYRGNLQPSEK